MRPAGPEPTTATRMPVGGASSGVEAVPCTRSQSATKRSMRPIATGSPRLATTHTTSHCSSCGQTRPQIAGRVLVSLSLTSEPATSPWRSRSMKAGMSIPTGHPLTHGGLAHCRQRCASTSAVSGS